MPTLPTGASAWRSLAAAVGSRLAAAVGSKCSHADAVQAVQLAGGRPHRRLGAKANLRLGSSIARALKRGVRAQSLVEVVVANTIPLRVRAWPPAARVARVSACAPVLTRRRRPRRKRCRRTRPRSRSSRWGRCWRRCAARAALAGRAARRLTPRAADHPPAAHRRVRLDDEGVAAARGDGGQALSRQLRPRVAAPTRTARPLTPHHTATTPKPLARTR